MKIFKNLVLLTIIFSIVFFESEKVKAQSFICTADTTSLVDTLGSEMVFTMNLKNISQDSLTAIIIRTENELPQNWTSSLCFSVCFPPFVDTIITNSNFLSHPIAPDSSLEFTLHVFVDAVTNGTAHVRLRVGDYFNPSDTLGFQFTASTLPLTSVKEEDVPNSYSLRQNYPNPFNPSTKINFTLAKTGYVTLKVYDVIGKLVKTLLDGYKSSGDHTINFNATNLPSGIYFYRLQSDNFNSVRKMILIK